jgi:hypothetical protein
MINSEIRRGFYQKSSKTVVMTAIATKHQPTNQLTEQQNNLPTIQQFKQRTNQVTTKLSMSLQPCGSWPLFKFLDILHSQ